MNTLSPYALAGLQQLALEVKFANDASMTTEDVHKRLVDIWRHLYGDDTDEIVGRILTRSLFQRNTKSGG